MNFTPSTINHRGAAAQGLEMPFLSIYPRTLKACSLKRLHVNLNAAPSVKNRNDCQLVCMINNCCGPRDGSVCKGPAVQASGPEFSPPHLQHRQGSVHLWTCCGTSEISHKPASSLLSNHREQEGLCPTGQKARTRTRYCPLTPHPSRECTCVHMSASLAIRRRHRRGRGVLPVERPSGFLAGVAKAAGTEWRGCLALCTAISSSTRTHTKS